MIDDEGDAGVLPFRRLEHEDDDEAGDGGDAGGGALTVPLLGRTYDGEWLRYVDDVDGASVPALHVYRVVEHRDSRNRRTVKPVFAGLVPYYFDESDLRRAVDEDGEREYPPGEYRVQLKADSGRLVTGSILTLGGRPSPARAPTVKASGTGGGAGDVGAVFKGEIAELRKAHAAELDRVGSEARRMRDLVESERAQISDLRAEVMRKTFEVERREMELATARELRARAEERAAEAEQRARAAEKRALEAEQRALQASAPPDLGEVVTTLKARLARDMAALEQAGGSVGGKAAPVERDGTTVIQEAASGLHATLKEFVSLGKTAMRGIETGALAKEADDLADALAGQAP